MVVLLVHRSISFIVLYNVLSSLFLFSHEFFTNLFMKCFYVVLFGKRASHSQVCSIEIHYVYVCVIIIYVIIVL